MKKLSVRSLLTVVVGVFSMAVARGAIVTQSGPIVLGEWNTNFANAKQYAEAHHIPMVLFWANPGCGVCATFKRACEKEAFIAWQHERQLVMVFSEGDNNVKSFARNSTGRYPYMCIYWPKADGTSSITRFSGINGQMPVKTGALHEQFMASVDAFLEDYKPAGFFDVSFALAETIGHRLEAEDGTSQIPVELIRQGDGSSPTTNCFLSVVGPDGKTSSTSTVTWSIGQTNQTVLVDISGVAFSSEGECADIILKNADGEEKSTNHVWYVSKNSASNPLWIGERTSSTLSWGEWTMDLDVAKAKTAGANGSAYTLAAVTGSLWCPDCANTERNFLGVEANGKNRFEEWAKAKQVALVTIDVPQFEEKTIESTKPSLLSRKAFSTTLARAWEYPASGADPSLTNAVLRSGLGYLNRKGASDAEAAAVLERNRILVQTNTDKSGFHRPEDSKPYRTGVPVFVLLRKDGSVAARLTRFAAVSPMADAKTKWDDIIKRFDEMLALADRTGEHADDIENNHPGTGATVFAANGGVAKGEISHVDVTDVFRLDGIGGNALLKVTVNGSTDAEVKVSFVELNTDGTKSVVGKEVIGTLSEGFSIEETFNKRGDYYLNVTCADIESDSFDVMSATAMNFHPFTVSGNVVLVPQQASATASASSGLSEIVMRLEKGTIYRITGLAAGNAALKALGDDLYEAIEGGDATLTTIAAGGEVAYQKWEPGTYGFKSVSQTMSEAAGEVEVVLTRTGGSSGSVTVEVMLNAEDTTLVDAFGVPRYEFETTTVTWEDGDVEPKTVAIKLKSNGTFDGTGVIALTTRLLSGWAKVAEGRAEYRLTVTGNTVGFISSETVEETLYRYVAFTNAYALVPVEAGKKVALKKLSGTLPAGLKAVYDSSVNAMAICGVPSAKAGRYETVYQVKAGSDAGLPKKIVFIIADPTGTSGSGQGTVNPSVAKTRTFRDVPVVDYKARRLAGVIQLTIPQRGNVSAKYTCDSGTLSLSSKGWSWFDPETRSLGVELTGRGGISVVVTCRTDGTVDISVFDPSSPEAVLEAQVDHASIWSKDAPAKAWKGYYTAALKLRDASIAESTPFIAPRGYGYLTLKMTTASAVNSGKVTWAGMLPNGTAMSGSTVLANSGEWALLPIVRTSSRDVFSACMKIAKNAVTEKDPRAIFPDDDIDSCWIHTERDAAFGADYAALFDVYGGPYDLDKSLADSCSEYYETTTPYLQFDLTSIGWSSYGQILAERVSEQVTVGAKTLFFVDAASVPKGLTVKIASGTGVVSGTVPLPFDNTKVVAWRGVILHGWGPGCGCTETIGPMLPFAVGAYYFNDTHAYDSEGKQGRCTVKRGGIMQIQ